MSHYQLRYGDGYATIVRPTWSEHGGLNASVDVVEEGDDAGSRMVEANVTLKPRGDGGPFSEVQNLPQVEVTAPFNGGSNKAARPEMIDVDLYIERVGDDGAAGVLPFPMTQTPFPTDDSKTNVLFVKEHSQFKGAVDNFSIERASGQIDRGCMDKFLIERAAGYDRNISASMSSKKRKESPTDATPTKEGGKTKKKKKDKSNKKQKTSKKSAAKSSKDNDDDDGANKSSPKRAPSAQETPNKETPSEKSPENKASSEKKSHSSSKKASSEKTFKMVEKASPKKTTKKTAEDKKEPPKSSAKKASKKKKDDDIDSKKEKKPKRPPNGYMMFSSDIRPKIMKENPGLKVTEVAKKTGAAYRALGDDEKKKYTDAAKEALDKFKEEHPDLPKSTRKKKNKEPTEEEEANAAVGNDEVIDGDEKVDDVEDKPKRPLNAYMTFSNEVRAKIKEDNPDAKPTEIMSKVGEAYRALGDDAKKQYKDVAGAAMAKFKEEHGDDALKRKSKKKKKQTNSGDVVVKRQSSGGGGGSHPTGDNLAHIPAEPAAGFPEGWTTQSVPRKTGDKSDMYWFSPAKSFKFRSKPQVKRFRESLERAGGGDEVAAMELYLREEKEKSGGNNGSSKKRKAISGKKKKDDGSGGVKDDGNNSSDGDEVLEA